MYLSLQGFSTFTTFNRLPKMVLYARLEHQTNTAMYCDNITEGSSEKRWLQMYVQWQGMSTVGKQQAAKITRNADDNGAKFQERTATAYDNRIQTVKEMQ
jgi:hypothetical protein